MYQIGVERHRNLDGCDRECLSKNTKLVTRVIGTTLEGRRTFVSSTASSNSLTHLVVSARVSGDASARAVKTAVDVCGCWDFDRGRWSGSSNASSIAQREMPSKSRK